MENWAGKPYGYRLGVVIAAAICLPLLYRLLFSDWQGTVNLFTSARVLWILGAAVLIAVLAECRRRA